MRNLKLAAIISGPTFNDAVQQIAIAEKDADIFELRLDLLSDMHVGVIRRLTSLCSKPFIFTLRSSRHGGNFTGGIEEQCAILQEVIQLNPYYIDIECHLPEKFFAECILNHPQTQIICSYHNFTETPQNLAALFDELQQKHAHLYKIATWAKSSLDSMRMLSFLNKGQDSNLIAICMGEQGQSTRILSSIFGNPIVFASIRPSEFSTNALLDLNALIHTYQIRRHNKDTKIYALIGDPVIHSKSHVTHNQVFKFLKQNAVYIKMRLQSDELPQFIKMAEELSFSGVSVTMPLKEAVGDFFNTGPINTLIFKDKNISIDNTDAKAVLDLLQELTDLNEKKIAILGIGGTAKAIAQHLLKYGAKLIIFNRTFEKAYEFAKKINARAHPLEEFTPIAQQGFDILINCTSVGFNDPQSSPIPLVSLPKHCIVLDVISTPKDTLFIRYAKAQGCTVIDGQQLFTLQAAKQFALWLDPNIEKSVLDTLKRELFPIS